MKFYISLLSVMFVLFISACSGGGGDPVLPSGDSEVVTSQEASDVLYLSSSDVVAYKAYGVYNVTIDPINMTGEIIPSRNATAIGLVFDADLTQFLMVTPCSNCLQIDGISLLPDDQVSVGFAIRHPFADPSKRPDLHGFDARGIVLAKGNFNFADTMVQLNDVDAVAVRANVSLMANPDGFTHHFDELALDDNYFDPPRSYDANINPFKRYFENGAAGTFDFENPSGYNVIPCGSDWETQEYIFNLEPGGSTLDFGFVVDCAYGASATFQNRFNPYYFLPEFNRKEAWKAEPIFDTNNLQAGDTFSSATLHVNVYDWQAGMVADPNYPDPANLSGISTESDVATISVELPGVYPYVEVSAPTSGTGSGSDPYVFNLTIFNSLGASGGTYCGIIAVRDDLQGQVGPLGIPESPAGFPYAGPEIYDYSTYSIFSVRVNGSPPDITSIPAPTGVYENDMVTLNANVTEVDGDDVTYLWAQTSPVSPVGLIVDTTVKNAQFVVPSLDDIPPAGIEFTLQLTASDIDGQDVDTVTFTALEINSAPVCVGIDTIPSFGVIQKSETMSRIRAIAFDPDWDDLIYEWDMDYDGFIFDVDETGRTQRDYSWADQGFYTVACKITEDRTNALDTMCSRTLIQEGFSNNEVMVNEDVGDPNSNFCFPDVIVAEDSMGNLVNHVVYQDQNDDRVIYCNDAGLPGAFETYVELASELPSGWTGYTKIAENDGILLVAWLETNPTPSNVDTVKFRSFDDYTGSWTSEVDGVVASDPNFIRSIDLCAGEVPGQFYLFYVGLSSSNYSCMLVVSDDNGATWSLPGAPSNGQFRDTVNADVVSDPMIKVTPGGVIHTVWRGQYSGNTHHWYDYNTDGGATWHTDLQLSDGVGGPSPSMDVDDSGNVHFVFHEDGEELRYVNTVYGNPPVIGTRAIIRDESLSSDGTAFYSSPDAGTLVTVFNYWSGGNYYMDYYVSFDGGMNWGLFPRDPSTDSKNWPACAGMAFSDPDRVQLFNIWIDGRTLSWPEGHIYGEFLYLAQRF